jgi:hypothetical protein
MEMAERQRKLNGKREKRQPRATPDVRSNPTHVHHAPRIGCR